MINLYCACESVCKKAATVSSGTQTVLFAAIFVADVWPYLKQSNIMSNRHRSEPRLSEIGVLQSD